MKIELNGIKIVKVDHYMCCEDCPLDRNGPSCLGHVFIKDCRTGFKYEDSM